MSTHQKQAKKGIIDRLASIAALSRRISMHDGEKNQINPSLSSQAKRSSI
jgi:hypothetical protein